MLLFITPHWAAAGRVDGAWVRDQLPTVFQTLSSFSASVWPVSFSLTSSGGNGKGFFFFNTYIHCCVLPVIATLLYRRSALINLFLTKQHGLTSKKLGRSHTWQVLGYEWDSPAVQVLHNPQQADPQQAKPISKWTLSRVQSLNVRVLLDYYLSILHHHSFFECSSVRFLFLPIWYSTSHFGPMLLLHWAAKRTHSLPTPVYGYV